MDAKKIGETLRSLRGNKTAKEVAGEIGISVSAVYMYENGERIPKDEVKIRFSKYYKKSIESIFYTGEVHDT